jgi:cytoskeletal protein CcmA (bactofilin family)
MLKKNASFREGVDTLIGVNSTFTGSIEADGTVRVDGKLIGDIKITGDCYVGDQASVNGNIEASNVHLAGKVEGNITAKGILKILSTAKLYGNIKINSFVADEGAIFQGKCEMLDSPASDKSPERSGKRGKKGGVHDGAGSNEDTD